jgi:hypothetical protein
MIGMRPFGMLLGLVVVCTRTLRDRRWGHHGGISRRAVPV